jgi:hypothetical protein
MRWIRSPWWDGLWLLSGFPLGMVLYTLVRFAGHHHAVGCPPGGCIGLDEAILSIYFLVLFQTAHTIAPITLAWSHTEYRRGMLQRPLKYVALPLVVLICATVIGVVSAGFFPNLEIIDDATGKMVLVNIFPVHVYPGYSYHPLDWTRLAAAMTVPMWWLIILYILWNTYHFAMQNFGVLSIYKARSGIEYGAHQRMIDKTFCMVIQIVLIGNMLIEYFAGSVGISAGILFHALLMVAAIAMLTREAVLGGQWVSPRILFAGSQAMTLMLAPGIWGALAINATNHWLTAIGLSAHVSGKHSGRSPLIFAGAVMVAGFALWTGVFWNGKFDWNLRHVIMISVPIMSARFGLGFWHFLQDRWVWKLSDPQVRETIGADLLREAHDIPA